MTRRARAAAAAAHEARLAAIAAASGERLADVRALYDWLAAHSAAETAGEDRYALAAQRLGLEEDQVTRIASAILRRLVAEGILPPMAATEGCA